MRAGLVIVAFACFFTQSGAAQAPAVELARTPEGRPDFQGVWGTRWTTPLERPPNLPSLVMTREQGEAQHRGTMDRFSSIDPLGADYAWDFLGPLVIQGETRSSLLIDPPNGRLPYTDEGRAQRGRFTTPFTGDQNIEERSLTERCLMGGSGYAPFLAVPAGNLRQIIQTGDTLVFHSESLSQLRIVPLDGGVGPVIPRGGSSSGHWEGETLVVETAGLHEDDRYRSAPGSTFVISPATRITERFTLIGPDEILYRFTIEDATLYTQAWTAESLMRRDVGPVLEFACHEGNHALSGILGGARAMERRTQ